MAARRCRSEGDGEETSRARAQKRPVRRGARGGRSRAQISSAHPATFHGPSVKAPVSNPRVGSRRAHFQKGFDQSVVSAIPTARQIANIKERAESRRILNRTPLPPRAAHGLHVRQRRLHRLSRHWGDAWEKATGEPGRRYWRSLLFRACRQESLDVEEQTTLFGEVESVLAVQPGEVEGEERPRPTFACAFCGRITTNPRICRHCGGRSGTYEELRALDWRNRNVGVPLRAPTVPHRGVNRGRGRVGRGRGRPRRG